jgi:protein O-mannosyl-transferase
MMSASETDQTPENGKTPTQLMPRWRVPMICLVLAAISFAVFGQTVTHEFVNFDDNAYVYENPVVARGLTRKGIVWAFTGFHASNWHPLTWLSHMLDCQLYGLHPGGHHLTNVLLHTATVILLFLVLREMTGALWRSAFVAAVFAIHPLRVESVAWVAERKDVLSGLFFMLTIGAYVRYARRQSSWGRYGLVMVLFAMGLMCKPMLVTLPAVLLLLDYWPLRRVESPGRLVMEKLPLLALSAASCITTILAQDKIMLTTESLSVAMRLQNALTACAVYLGQMVCPTGLAVLYPFPPNGPPRREVALAVVVMAGLSAVAWAARLARPWLLVGWVCYLVMLLPVLGIIQVGGQAHADRYTYLPQIGIYVALTWLVAEIRLSRLAIGTLMTVVIALLMVCAWQQTAYWQDSETLWTRTLDCTSDNAVARYDFGTFLLRKGNVDEAITQFRMALEIKPNYVDAHNNLGTAFLRKGGVYEAIAQYRMALQRKPNFPDAHNNLGTALQQMGDLAQAIFEYRTALQIKPNYANAHYNLGVALMQMGRVAEAISQYRQALEIEPDNAKALNNLAWLLATSSDASLRDGAKALELARRANALTGGANPGILHTLAAAFAEVGQFDDAKRTAHNAIDRAWAGGLQDLAEKLEGELKRYQAGLPCRQ